MACPVSVKERLRGWRLRTFPCGSRPYADLRVQLTGGCRAHSSRRGGVLSPCNPTASGMALQCPGWRHDGGDGRAGPMVMEETRLTYLMSRRGPRQVWNRCPPPFEGSTVLFRGCGVSAVREWVAQCHGANASLVTQCRTVAGMASPGEFAE
jgi:hypothetical protein